MGPSPESPGGLAGGSANPKVGIVINVIKIITYRSFLSSYFSSH